MVLLYMVLLYIVLLYIDGWIDGVVEHGVAGLAGEIFPVWHSTTMASA